MILQTTSVCVEEVFMRELPLCFKTRGPKPLKINIYQDLLQYYRGETRFNSKDIAQALKQYMDRYAYLQGLTEGSVRVDLWGKTAGIVTSEEAAQARRLIYLKADLQTTLTSSYEDLSEQVFKRYNLFYAKGSSTYHGAFAVHE